MPSSLNPPAPDVPYFTPIQAPAGVPQDATSAPTLFQPLQIRGVTLLNRFVVSPMCTYSAKDGLLNDWHLAHASQFAMRGAGLTIVEATAVEARGRISPEDAGLYSDNHIPIFRRITDLIHSQGHKAGIQLAHSGRKASTVPLWLAVVGGQKNLVMEKDNGWPNDVVAPSPTPYASDFPDPKELTVEEIGGIVQQFADAAKRAVEAGFDIIEIHGAHGFLISSFLSLTSNKRTDQYGGSFENRTRILVEIIRAIRAVIPVTMPLFLRISVTEWLEHSDYPETWDIESTLRLARLLPGLGVDLLDVSSGGNNIAQNIPKDNPRYQTDLAGRIRRTLHAEGITNLLIGAVGLIRDAQVTRDLVQDDAQTQVADLAFIARQFLHDPSFVFTVARELGVPVHLPKQYSRGILAAKEMLEEHST